MNTKRIVSLFASLSLVLSMSLGLTGCGDKAAQDDNQGSTDGEKTLLLPNDSATRAQLAAILMRFMKTIAK